MNLDFIKQYCRGSGLVLATEQLALNERYDSYTSLIKDGDIERLPEANSNFYGYLISMNMLQRVRNPIIALKNYLRVVKSGGHVIVTVEESEKGFNAKGNNGSSFHLLKHLLALQNMKESSFDLEFFHVDRNNGSNTATIEMVLKKL